ncbi:sulfur carrier protein ThiS [Alcaligenes pakistanensis]
MNITLNGQSKTLKNSDTVSTLIVELGYENKRIAVELNGDIVPKSQHASTAIKEGDTIEIVVAVGGG